MPPPRAGEPTRIDTSVAARAGLQPGDVILADIDGVLCVPRAIAHAVLLRAEEIRANETKIFGWVAEGQSLRQIADKGGYF